MDSEDDVLRQARRYLADHPAASEQDLRQALRQRFVEDSQGGPTVSAGSDAVSGAVNVIAAAVAGVRMWLFPRWGLAFEEQLDRAVAALRAEGRWPAASSAG